MNKTLDNIYEEMLAVFAEVSGYLQIGRAHV